MLFASSNQSSHRLSVLWSAWLVSCVRLTVCHHGGASRAGQTAVIVESVVSCSNDCSLQRSVWTTRLLSSLAGCLFVPWCCSKYPMPPSRWMSLGRGRCCWFHSIPSSIPFNSFILHSPFIQSLSIPSIPSIIAFHFFPPGHVPFGQLSCQFQLKNGYH